MRAALATSTRGVVVARLLRLPFVPICGIARRSLDHMVGSVCGCGELCLGVTWRRLYDERIVVDVYIGGSVDVQNGSLTSSVTALVIMIRGGSIGSHHVRHVPAPRARYDLVVLRCLIHLHIAH